MVLSGQVRSCQMALLECNSNAEDRVEMAQWTQNSTLKYMPP